MYILTAVLVLVILVLYVCGCFLMRAFLRTNDTTDRDKWRPVLTWPVIMIDVIWDCAIKNHKKFEW